MATDVAWIDVLPTGKGFLPALDKMLGGIMPGAGKRAGDQYSKAFGDAASEGIEKAATRMEAATAKVTRATDAETAAQRRAADALDATSIAREKLNAVLQRENSTSAQRVAATAALEKATRSYEAAQQGVVRAASNITIAQDGVARATANVERAHNAAAGSKDRDADATGRLGMKLLGLKLENEGLERTSNNLTGSLRTLGLVGVASLGALGGSGIVGGVVALGAAVASASGAVLLLPAAAVAVAAPLATFKLGLIGVDEAFKQLGKGDMTKFNAALETMAPSARAVFQEIALLKPGFDALRQSIQGEMFAGLATPVRELGEKWFPLVRGELGQFASLINGAALGVAGFGLQSNVLRDVQAILGNVRMGFGELTGAIRPALQIFTDLALVGSTFIPGLSNGLTGLIERTAAWVTEARQTGVLRDIMVTALSVIGDLMLILGNLGSILRSVFQAGQESGAGFLETIRNVTGEFARFLNSDYGSSLLAGAFSAIGTALQAILPLISTVGGIILGQVVPAFAGLGAQLAPIANQLLVQLGYALGQILPILPLLGQLIIAVVSAFLPWIPILTSLITTLLPPIISLLTFLAPIFPALVIGITALVAIMRIWNAVWLALTLILNANPIMLIVTAVGILAAALYTAYTQSETFRGIVDAAFRAVGAAGMWMWDNALRPAFDGLMIAWNAVGTAIAWVWNTLIMPAWSALQTAASFMWNSVLLPAFNGIMTAWNALGAAIMWAWENVIRPTWDFLSLAARVLVALILTAVLTPIILLWNEMSAQIMWGWNNVIKPAWELMQLGASILWDVWIKPRLDALIALWDWLGRFVMAVWNDWIRPAWEIMQAAINILWTLYVQPRLNDIGALWDWLGRFFMSVWNDWIKPAWEIMQVAVAILWNTHVKPILDKIGAGWDALGRGVRAVYDNIIRPAWDLLVSGLGWVRDNFNDAVNGIGKVWGRLQDLLKVPINFVIREVWNGGIVKAWNAVAGTLGLGPITPLAEIGAAPTSFGPITDRAEGGPLDFYRGGGPIRGKYRGPTADNLLGVVDNDKPIKVNPYEWIHPVSSRKQYGDGFMRSVQHGTFPTDLAKAGATSGPRRYRANEKVRRDDVREKYGLGGPISGYALGGLAIPGFAQGTIVDLGRRLQGMGAKVTEHPSFGGVAPVHSANSLHYSGRAIDVNTRPGTSALEQSELDPMAALARSLGFRTIWRTTGHFNHLHADDASGPSMGASGTGVIGSVVAAAKATIADLFAGFKSGIANLFEIPARAAVKGIGALIGNPPPRWKEMPPALGNKVIDEAVKWFTGKAQAKADAEGAAAAAAGTAGGGGATTGSYGGVLAKVKAVGDEVQAKFGGMTVGGFAKRNIAGTSTVSDHALGKALDFMTYTNMAKGQQIADFLVANAGRLGSDNVIWNRRIWSGSGWRAYGGASPHTDHVHWDTFANGGAVQMPTLFDRGGQWRSGTWGYNDSGRNERVLTAPQDRHWQRWTAVADRMTKEWERDGGGNRRGGRALVEHAHFHNDGPDAVHRGLEQLHRKVRLHERNGVHTDVTTFTS